MPHVAMPVDFTLPEGCALTEGGQAVQTGQNGSVIHWIAQCPAATASEMTPLFKATLAKQGWTVTTGSQVNQDYYRRNDLELVFEFVASAQPPTNYVWFAERYWR